MPILKPADSYQWYDTAGRGGGLTSRQVAAIVKKHNMRKRRIYGYMAVNVSDWQKHLKKETQDGVETSN